MHNNYFLLRHLTSVLESRLRGAVVSACFSQDKDELIFRAETNTGPFHIRATLHAAFSCLSFPDRYDRARQNAVDIFREIIGLKVDGIRQFENERCFGLELSSGFVLLFKMHGTFSNVILFRDSKLLALFKKNLLRDLSLDLAAIDREIDWSFENFVRHQGALRETYFTFGKVVWKYLGDRNFQHMDIAEQWREIQDLLERLRDPRYYITRLNDTVTLSLLPLGEIIKDHSDLIETLNDFCSFYLQQAAFSGERASAMASLRAALLGAEKYYEKTSQRAQALEADSHFKVWADLLMANMQKVEEGAETILLPNFYDNNRPTEIKLRKEWSAVKNAEAFYTKSKNQQKELSRLQPVLSKKQAEIASLKERLDQLSSTSNLQEVRKIAASMGLRKSSQKSKDVVPYHTFEYSGYKIFVGKNSQSNDTLTMKHSYKEDLWLHAKDVAGSHVVIKYQAGKKFPRDVIIHAAELAAYNSKRKTETLCPVIFTPRKYVRKRKGDPVGAVVVEREETIMVEPKLHQSIQP